MLIVIGKPSLHHSHVDSSFRTFTDPGLPATIPSQAVFRAHGFGQASFNYGAALASTGIGPGSPWQMKAPQYHGAVNGR